MSNGASHIDGQVIARSFAVRSKAFLALRCARRPPIHLAFAQFTMIFVGSVGLTAIIFTWHVYRQVLARADLTLLSYDRSWEVRRCQCRY